MNKKQKNGFTLVELLAVIVILAIILVIAVPKVMDIISDAKKATLESTVKMIASAAEKAKVQNTVLGKDTTITCESVVKLNNVDYEGCEIEFNGDEASVTIKGKGKFAGISVCGGTKTISTASDDDCTSSIITGVTTITNLLSKESTLNNGLQEIIIDPSTSTSTSTSTSMQNLTGTINAGIRYVGENPNNKVYYNCEDTYNGVSYGNSGYDYSKACEVWRIIGVFDVAKINGGTTEKRIKIVNTESTFKASWDSSDSSVNNGVGITQWGPSGSYEGADLMRLLNGYYIGKSGSECKYCNGSGQATCEQVCTKESLKTAKMKPLTSKAKNMIEDAVWSTYGAESRDVPQQTYLQEMGIINRYTGCGYRETKICDLDDVTRENIWIGLVGLISFSDVSYANEGVFNDLYSWTITPYVNNQDYAFIFTSSYPSSADGVKLVFPSVYLKSKVQIIGGNGGTEPFKLK